MGHSIWHLRSFAGTTVNKEIEETKKHLRAQKQLEEYAKTLVQQMQDRGLYYIVAIIDPSTGASTMGCEGRTNCIESMTNTIVKTALSALVKDGVKARSRLSEVDPDFETWNETPKH